MEYTLGFAGVLHTNGATEGDVNPSNGMLISDQQGYMLIKAKGVSPKSTDGSFTFHLGGFEGMHSIVSGRTTDFFGESISVPSRGLVTLNFMANPAKLWHASPSVSQVNTLVGESAEAAVMALNFFGGVNYSGAE
jgi:hypothetical protein